MGSMVPEVEGVARVVLTPVPGAWRRYLVRCELVAPARPVWAGLCGVGIVAGGFLHWRDGYGWAWATFGTGPGEGGGLSTRRDALAVLLRAHVAAHGAPVEVLG